MHLATALVFFALLFSAIGQRDRLTFFAPSNEINSAPLQKNPSMLRGEPSINAGAGRVIDNALGQIAPIAAVPTSVQIPLRPSIVVTSAELRSQASPEDINKCESFLSSRLQMGVPKTSAPQLEAMLKTTLANGRSDMVRSCAENKGEYAEYLKTELDANRPNKFAVKHEVIVQKMKF